MPPTTPKQFEQRTVPQSSHGLPFAGARRPCYFVHYLRATGSFRCCLRALILWFSRLARGPPNVGHEPTQGGDLYSTKGLVRGTVAGVVETVGWGLKIPPVFISLFGVFVTGCSTPIQAVLVRYAIRPLFGCSLPKMSLPTFGRAKPLSGNLPPDLQLAYFASDEGH